MSLEQEQIMDTSAKLEKNYIFLPKMRILYLPSLIAREETKEIQLRNCNLVVDAHTFFFDSYKDSRLLSTFGIEANAYANYLIEKIKIFELSNVTCYFVFDGGKTDIDRKIKCVQTLNFDFEANKSTSFIFMKSVCFQVLKEAGLNFATCVVEGKEDCTVLARKLGCAVLSDNIQFCFKNVPYISIPSLKYKYSNKCITANQFQLSDFLAKHSLTETKAAIFATLSDIEVFPSNYFDELLKRWGVWNKYLYSQHKNLLKWLSKQEEEILKKCISKFLSSEEDIKKFFDQVQRILDNMRNKNTSSVVADYLYNDLKLSVSNNDPSWFEKGVAAQKISINFINLYKHKFIRGSRAIQEATPIDSIMISIDIIKYVYNLLTNYEENGSFCVYQPAGDTVMITTQQLNVKKPVYDCIDTVFENGWKDIQRLRLFEHFLNENNINLNKLNTVPDNARMLIVALVYFTRMKQSTDINVMKQVYCFIISYVLLDRPQLMKKEMEKYFKCNEEEARRIFDADILKSLEEIQYCLLHMNYLNVLCGTSYTPTTYHTTYNGTFIYKLLTDMSDCNPEHVIEQLLHTSPTALSDVKTLIRAYQDLCYEQV